MNLSLFTDDILYEVLMNVDNRTLHSAAQVSSLWYKLTTQVFKHRFAMIIYNIYLMLRCKNHVLKFVFQRIPITNSNWRLIWRTLTSNHKIQIYYLIKIFILLHFFVERLFHYNTNTKTLIIHGEGHLFLIIIVQFQDAVNQTKHSLLR